MSSRPEPPAPAAGDAWPSTLIASYHTLSGVPPRTPARFSLAERLGAARRAGYDGIGLAHYDYGAQLDRGTSPAEIRAAVTAERIPVVELEILYGWNDDEDPTTARADEQRVYALADLVGARHVNVAVAQPPGTPLDVDDVARRFAALCDRAARHDLLVALEFQPLNAVSDLETAWQVVRRAARPNGGIALDSWHFFRGTPDYAVLRSIPPERIVVVQINDADSDPVGTLWDDTVRRRRLPGDGDFPLEIFVATLRDHGVRCPLSVEIISDEHMAVDAEEAARRSYDATRALLDRAARVAASP